MLQITPETHLHPLHPAWTHFFICIVHFVVLWIAEKGTN